MRTRLAPPLGLALLAAGLIGAPGTATAAAPIATPIAAQVLWAPYAVTAADGRMHLAYEIRVANRAPNASTVTLTSVTARSSGGAVRYRLSGAALASRVRIDTGKEGAVVLGPGQGATIFMDVTGKRGKVPRKLFHGFGVLVQAPDSSPPRAVSFSGVPTAVHSRPPVVVAPPLRGTRWLAADGCCPLNAHRGAVLPIDGTLHVSERFAIDFVRLRPDNRLFNGPIGDLASYAYFGTRVHAAAAGRVVRVHKGEPQHVPGTFPPGLTVQNAGGNYIVVRIAPHRYTFYAHLQSQSIKLRKGDRVRRGQVIALLGNSGNSQAPHLHFHVIDGPSPLSSNGVPYEFTSFTGQGRVTDDSMLVSANPVPVDPRELAGRHRRQLPLTNQLLSFR